VLEGKFTDSPPPSTPPPPLPLPWTRSLISGGNWSGSSQAFEQIAHEFSLAFQTGEGVLCFAAAWRCLQARKAARGCAAAQRGPAGRQFRIKSQLLTPLMCRTCTGISRAYQAARSGKLEQPKPARNIQRDKSG
jgi:hypothetical protein